MSEDNFGITKGQGQGGDTFGRQVPGILLKVLHCKGQPHARKDYPVPDNCSFEVE